MSKHSVRAILAVASAVFGWASVALNALMLFGATSNPDTPIPDWATSDPRTLDYNTLNYAYKWMRTQTPVTILIYLFGAMSHASIAYVVLVLQRVFKRYKGGQTDLPMFMTACFFIGAILPSVQFLTAVGFDTMSANFSAWSSMNDAMNPGPLQALYIAHELVRSSFLYLWVVQFIFVPTGLILAAVMTFETELLPRGHGVLGIITAITGFLVFIMSIITYNLESLVPAIILGVALILYGVILAPTWAIWLGVVLARLKKRGQNERENRK